MDRKNYIKNTIEWEALNRIWKSCTMEQREVLYSDFQVISNLIKKSNQNLKKELKDDFGYLNSLSLDARGFVIQLVKDGEPNLYHSIMAVINNKQECTKEEIEKFYFEKYALVRPYLEENKNLVKEVIGLCWKRHLQRL